MATIKSFTSLEQSKVLAEILPLESADMCYKCIGEDPYDVTLRPYSEWKEEYKGLLVDKEVDVIPCWSLAALLDVLPTNLQIVLAINDFQGNRKEKYVIGSVQHDRYDCYADNPVDACVDMIIKLKERNLL